MAQVAGGGGWDCKDCWSHNIGDHRQCTSCRKWRDLDWNCLSCGFNNFAKRATCKHCNEPQGALTGGAPPAGVGGGYGSIGEGYAGTVGGGGGFDNIVGSGGGGYQAGYQDHCQVSYPAPPADPGYQDFSSAPAPTAPTETPWLCGLCNTENAQKRILCFECSGHRERVEVRNRAAEGRLQASQPAPRRSLLMQPSSRADMYPSERRAPLIRTYADGKVEDQTLDWHCSNCSNRNFAKRKACNKCNKSREEVEKKDSAFGGDGGFAPSFGEMMPPRYPREERPNYRHAPRLGSSEPVPAERPEDRTGDWACTECQNRNFAKRKQCNRCSKPREEVEDKELKFNNDNVPPPRKRAPEPIFMDHAKQVRRADHNGGRPEDLTNDWMCGRCNINCFAKKKECFRCGRPRAEVEQRGGAPLGGDVSYPGYNQQRGGSWQAPRIQGHNLQLSRFDNHRDNYRDSSREEKPRKKFVVEDRSNDWTCKDCNINNFLKRKTCFKCGKDKNECVADDEVDDVVQLINEKAEENVEGNSVEA